jgi:hypothetical protein
MTNSKVSKRRTPPADCAGGVDRRETVCAAFEAATAG